MDKEKEKEKERAKIFNIGPRYEVLYKYFRIKISLINNKVEEVFRSGSLRSGHPSLRFKVQ